MNKRDRSLGMDADISRRDFLNGVSVAIGASLLPPAANAQDVGAQDLPGYYPPQLSGMRGSHAGSFEAAHMARDGATWDGDDTVTEGSPATDDPREAMRWKLRTAEGREIYARRKSIVEPVFGQIKEARGVHRFLLRGLEAVQAEWQLICLTHNLLKAFRNQTAIAA